MSVDRSSLVTYARWIPRYKDLFVPQCVNMLYCPEKHSCGKYGSKDDLLKLLNERNNK